MEPCQHCAKQISLPPRLIALRSSQVEPFLLQTLVATIAEELWRRDHRLDLCVLNDMIGDSGYDLVLCCNGSKRYIQVKHSCLQGNPVRFSLWQEFSKLMGNCAVVLVHASDPWEVDHCLFFGSGPQKPMPSVLGFPKTQAPGRRAIDQVRPIRENLFDVPRQQFQGPISPAELVERLFPRLRPGAIRAPVPGPPRSWEREPLGLADSCPAAASPISGLQSCLEA